MLDFQQRWIDDLRHGYMVTESGDARAVYQHGLDLLEGRIEGPEISDGVARTFASWYYEGHQPLGYRFVSTGYVPTPCDDLIRELYPRGGASAMNRADEAMYNLFGTYLLNRPDRNTPVAGWSGVWAR